MVRLLSILWSSGLLLRLASALAVSQQVLENDNGKTDLIDHDTLLNETDVETYELSNFNYNSCENWNPTQWDYDVVIVGGGPAGLAASMSLGRVARTSLMYDSEEYRNAKTRYMHDVLGQDGRFPNGL